MHVPAGDAVRLVAEQKGRGRLVVAQIGGKTGEAMRRPWSAPGGIQPSESDGCG